MIAANAYYVYRVVPRLQLRRAACPPGEEAACAAASRASRALLSSAGTARAQLSEVRQTIFGMDCAVCAHAVRVAVQRLGGVESVRVSLNDGVAEIRLAPDNSVTLAQLREIIWSNGFTPKGAEVVVAGRRWLWPARRDPRPGSRKPAQPYRRAASP